MSLLDEAAEIEHARKPKPAHPEGWEPGIAWNGRTGTITSRPLAEPTPDWDALLRVWGFDPATHEVVEPVQVRTWDAAIGNGEVRTMWYFRAGIRAKRSGAADIGELVKLVRRSKRAAVLPKGSAGSDRSYWLSHNDLQLGKRGTKATVDRIVRAIDASAARVKASKRAGKGFASIYLPGVGDLLEACGQHYPMQPYEVELDSREQRRLARRIILYSIDAHASLAERIVCPVVGGNHGENNRVDGKSTTTFGDNSDVEVYEGVAEAIVHNPASYGHVSFVIPGNDLTLTLQPIADGPIVGLAHGHQASRGATAAAKMWDWWKGQAMGLRPIGDATILLAGHFHQFVIHQDGARTLIIAPTIDSGSQWYAEQTGSESRPSMLSFIVTPQGWDAPRLL